MTPKTVTTVLLLLAGAAHAQVYKCGGTYQQTPCPGAAATPRAAAWVEIEGPVPEACHEAIRAKLVDPESVRFRPAPPHTAAQGTLNFGVAFNARNRMGGYVGFHRVVCRVLPDTGVVLKIID